MVRALELFLKNIMIADMTKEFDRMNQFIGNHATTPLIDRGFPLEEGPQALAYLDAEPGAGKVVVTI